MNKYAFGFVSFKITHLYQIVTLNLNLCMYIVELYNDFMCVFKKIKATTFCQEIHLQLKKQK